jgi:hypothetical protein
MSPEFNTTEYEFSHGKKPRGTGNWAFIPADSYWGSVIPEDGIEWLWGGYSDCKRELAFKYPAIEVWKVLS